MRLRTRLRTTSKVQEKQLIGMGKWLAKNPEALIPKCEHDCRRCDFDRMAQRLKKIANGMNDERFLKRMSKRGPQMTRAYAATVYRARIEKAGYLAVAKSPDGDIAYMYSPRVKKEALVGAQYFKDPRLRLLLYSDISKRRRLSFYSVGKDVYCSRDKPPSAFIDDLISRMHLSRMDEATISCGHDLKSRGCLRIDWKNADLSLILCEDCLENRNTFRLITQRMIATSLESLFSVTATIRLRCDEHCERCPSNDSFHFGKEDIGKYLAGELDDAKMFALATDRFLSSLKEKDYSIASIGIRCFGEDRDELARAIATDESELEAVSRLLSKLDFPIVLRDGMTPNKLLIEFWDPYGKKAVSEITGVPVDKLPDLTDGLTPISIIEKARKSAKRDAVRQSLPQYSELGPISSFSDRVAREAKTHGKEVALKLAVPSGHEQTRMKSVGLAFRIALGDSGMNWQYTKEEIDFANHLAPLAKRLIESDGEMYDIALKEFVSSAGADEKMVRRR